MTRSYPSLVLIALLLIGLFWAFWFTQAVTFSFAKLGLSPGATLLVLLASLFGGYVNIPVTRRRVLHRLPGDWHPLWPWQVGGPYATRWETDLSVFSRLLFYRPPLIVREQVLAINLGGAIVPLLVSLYLLPLTPLLPLLGATAGVAAVCYFVARPTYPVGILVPTFVPPLAAALLALLLAPNASPPVGYVAGTLGTLIGADLLPLPTVLRFDSQYLSIGGAGVHDAIFFAGLVAVVLA